MEPCDHAPLDIRENRVSEGAFLMLSDSVNAYGVQETNEVFFDRRRPLSFLNTGVCISKKGDIRNEDD